MSQCQGVGIFESGDYLLDERQGYLCSTIERLRAHMVILKEKLQEEKMLLSELKAETQYLTNQHIEKAVPLIEKPYFPEDYNPNRYQAEHEVTLSSLRPVRKVPYAGEVVKANKPILDPKHKFDRVEYVQRLNEIDSLCKEEMARVNSVVEQMEPLKQMASDWVLESRLTEVSGVPVPGDAITVPAQPGIEPTGFNPHAFPAELIVVPSERFIPQATEFVPERTCVHSDQPVLIQTPLIKFSKSKSELRRTNGQLKLDCMKTTPQNNTTIDKKDRVLNRKKEKKPKTSSSEASLSSLEALREKNITLIDVADNNQEEGDSKKLEKEDEEERKSLKESRSAISLESIQRAFANHRNKKRKKGATDTETFSLLHKARRGREMSGINKYEEEQREQDKLLAYLHPNAKKIIKNLVKVDDEKMIVKSSLQRKPERCSKKRVFNLGRNKVDELSLCQDDVINKFLYDEEGYVYTPLFVSETEDECN